MLPTPHQKIEDLLVSNLPRELVLGVEEAMFVGAQRGYASTRTMAPGHRSSALGQQRHFHMNETFHQTLVANEVQPTQLSGNRLVTGRSGMLMLGRFNMTGADWMKGSRSVTRKQLSKVNEALTSCLRPDFFTEPVIPTDITVFFVSRFSRALDDSAATPESLYIAVPDKNLKSWLFREPLVAFLKRYDQQPVQHDLAQPKLKKDIARRLDKNGTTS